MTIFRATQAKELRNHHIQLRLSPSELDLVDQAGEILGANRTAVVRVALDELFERCPELKGLRPRKPVATG